MLRQHSGKLAGFNCGDRQMVKILDAALIDGAPEDADKPSGARQGHPLRGVAISLLARQRDSGQLPCTDRGSRRR